MDFGFILELIMRQYGSSRIKSSKTKSETEYEIPINTSDSEMINIYTMGMDSIVRNIPRPNVNMVVNHSYVSMS